MKSIITDDLILLDLQNNGDAGTLGNRIAKRYKHLKKWARSTATDAFRIYDRDIPEYPLAVDYYAGRFNIQYFSKQQTENDEIPAEIRDLVNDTIWNLFSVDKSSVFWKVRKVRARLEQYEKIAGQKNFFTVYEHGQRFYINLCDYLDTGLFLDHRTTRQLAAARSAGKRVLNLFAYTGSFTVHCAAGGAISSTTVDMSNTYTEWTRENFVLNELNLSEHRILRADCLKYLQEAQNEKSRYDLIILDPPTLSRSKKMEDIFDVQEDHVKLLNLCGKLLSPNGEIIFSTNSRRFRLAEEALNGWQITDVTEKTIPADFRNLKIHKCWLLSR